MPVLYSLSESALDLRVGTEVLSRPVGAEDIAALKGLVTEYAELRGRSGVEARLLALGRALWGWLDGGERWMAQLLDQPPSPFAVEFQVPTTKPDAQQQLFLQVPWELLANEEGYLAQDAGLLYCPTRRLGKASAPAALDAYCLGLTFMADAQRGADELDYGAEENAILDATEGLELDLAVEESGNPQELAARLSRSKAMQVLHLSCHGRSEPTPVLLLETAEGQALPTDADTLLPAIRPRLPRLLFLSACKSAAHGELADSLSLAMVRAGVPAVLGWDGSVYDHEATAFARELYASLALKRPLEEAVSVGRRGLLTATDGSSSRDWHLARLWLGAAGGGPLSAGEVRRSLQATDHGHKAFLDKRRQQSPVASREAFVGRRREIQTSLRVLRQGEPKALLLHGMGRLGKSSLAARLAHRRPDLEPVVIFGKDNPAAYRSLQLAEAIKRAVPKTEAIIAPAQGALLDEPERLEHLLRQVLEGPCQQHQQDQPILLVIDDLEQILEAPTNDQGRWRAQPTHVAMLARGAARVHLCQDPIALAVDQPLPLQLARWW